MNVHILFFDWGIPREVIETVLSEKLNIPVLNFVERLKKQLRSDDELGKRMRSYIERAEPIPDAILNRFIAENIIVTEDDLMLSEYPKTMDQFLDLQHILGSKPIIIVSLWYVKQHEPNLFVKDYFKNFRNRPWLEKYGDEVLEKWNSEFKKQRELITVFAKAVSQPMNILEVTYAQALDYNSIQEHVQDILK
jgi:adenylate kinase family enzyme